MSSFTPTSCYNPVNVGTIGVELPCTDMLIVNRSMLDFAISNNQINGGEDFYLVHNGTNYTFGNSAYNVFTGQVTDMGELFSWSSFNASINYWDVSSVTNMSDMFYRSVSFNSDLSSWNVSSVTDMNYMFSGVDSFNSDLSSWDVSSVTDMRYMFSGVDSFNSDLSSWNVSSVINMAGMFSRASSFTSNLSSWNVSRVTNMDEMFNDAVSFDSDLSSWCVPLISAISSNFDTNTPAWNKAGRQPQWNTSC